MRHGMKLKSCPARAFAVPVLFLAPLRAAPPEENPENPVRSVFSARIEISGDAYNVEIVESRWQNNVKGDGAETTAITMIDSILYVERDGAHESIPRRAVWWSTAPVIRGAAVIGHPVYSVCPGRFKGRDAILLAIGNSYYHGVSVVIIDPALKSSVPPSLADVETKPFEGKPPFHAESQRKILRIRDLDKLPPYGTSAVAIEAVDDAIHVTLNHPGGNVSKLEYNELSERWTRLED